MANNLISYLETALPPSIEREEALTLIRLGHSFRQQQQVGKRPGFLKGYLLKLLPTMDGPITFDGLLQELELEAARRSLYGVEASPVEKVDRVWETFVYHHPKTGRQILSFKSLRNKLSWCKANLR